MVILFIWYGRVAELVDALDSKSGSRKRVRVRFPPRPPEKERDLCPAFSLCSFATCLIDVFELEKHYMLLMPYRLAKL